MDCQIRVGVILCVALFILPAADAPAQSLLDRLESQIREVLPAKPAEPSTAGRAAAGGYLGLVGDDAGEQGRGVRVLEVYPNTAASTAGLKAGDLITAISGRPVTRLTDMAAVLDGAPVGTRFQFRILRGDRPLQLLVTLRARAETLPPLPEIGDPPPLDGNPVPPPAAAAGGSPPALGVTVTDLTGQSRRELNVPVATGAVVSRLAAGSPAAAAGIPVGAVIVALDGRRIDSSDELRAAVRALAADRVEVAYYDRTRLIRRNVRLAGSDRPAPPPPPAVAQNGRRPDRPLLNRLEQALNGLAGDRRGPPPPPSVASPGDELLRDYERLRQRISDLERQLAEQQKRLEALEATLKPPQD